MITLTCQCLTGVSVSTFRLDVDATELEEKEEDDEEAADTTSGAATGSALEGGSSSAAAAAVSVLLPPPVWCWRMSLVMLITWNGSWQS